MCNNDVMSVRDSRRVTYKTWQLPATEWSAPYIYVGIYSTAPRPRRRRRQHTDVHWNSILGDREAVHSSALYNVLYIYLPTDSSWDFNRTTRHINTWLALTLRSLNKYYFCKHVRTVPSTHYTIHLALIHRNKYKTYATEHASAGRASPSCTYVQSVQYTQCVQYTPYCTVSNTMVRRAARGAAPTTRTCNAKALSFDTTIFNS